MGNQINVEFFFRLIYDCFHGSCYGSIDETEFIAWMTHLWLWIVLIGYILAILGLLGIVYSLVRLFELRKSEEHYYSTLIPMPGTSTGAHPRWSHIQSLAEGDTVSEWREAIIEADIMLDEVLLQHGYEGDNIGDKLRSANPAHFKTLKEAGEAHGVRNKIAHQGSEFALSHTITQRTLAKYEAVFRELKAI